MVPITGTDRNIRCHVRMSPPQGGLTKPSVIMRDQARARGEQRLLGRGVVSFEIAVLVQAMVGTCIDR